MYRLVRVYHFDDYLKDFLGDSNVCFCIASRRISICWPVAHYSAKFKELLVRLKTKLHLIMYFRLHMLKSIRTVLSSFFPLREQSKYSCKSATSLLIFAFLAGTAKYLHNAVFSFLLRRLRFVWSEKKERLPWEKYVLTGSEIGSDKKDGRKVRQRRWPNARCPFFLITTWKLT